MVETDVCSSCFFVGFFDCHFLGAWKNNTKTQVPHEGPMLFGSILNDIFNDAIFFWWRFLDDGHVTEVKQVKDTVFMGLHGW